MKEEEISEDSALLWLWIRRIGITAIHGINLEQKESAKALFIK